MFSLSPIDRSNAFRAAFIVLVGLLALWGASAVSAAPAAQAGSCPVGRFATTSTDGHTIQYCTIEEAIFASSGSNQEVHVQEGNWPGETMNRDYYHAYNVVVKAIGDRDKTIINGLDLSGGGFYDLTFQNFTLVGEAPNTPDLDYDTDYAVRLTGPGYYRGLSFVGNVFDGQDRPHAGAIFTTRGIDDFLLENNEFVNFNQSMPEDIELYLNNAAAVNIRAAAADKATNFVATDNSFDGISQQYALRARGWENTTITDNKVTAAMFGGFYVSSGVSNSSSVPVTSVNVSDNDVTITNSTQGSSVGIGVIYLDAQVIITDNEITGARTCVESASVSNLELTDNNLINCTEYGLLFSDEGYYVEGYSERPYIHIVSAIIEDNAFDTGPIGVVNATRASTYYQAEAFELNVCNNTFIDIDVEHYRAYADAGTFTPCGSDTGTITIIKETAGVPQPPTISFPFTGDLGNFSLTAGVSETFELEIGTYEVWETLPTNWGLSDITCTGGSSSEIENGVQIELEADDNIVCTFTNTPSCDNPAADLSGYIESNGENGWITNNSTAFCSWEVGMASYKRYNNDIDDQILFDYVDGVTVAPGQTAHLEIDIPECASQIDLFSGPVLQSLDGQRYNDRLIAARHKQGTNYCGNYANDPNTLTGFVTINGVPLSGVTVDIERLDTRTAVVGETTTTTDSDGYYGFAGLDLGRYQVTISGETLDGVTFETLSQVVELDGNPVANTDFTGNEGVPTAVTLSAAGTNSTHSNLPTIAVVLLFALTTLVLWRRGQLSLGQENRR